MGFFSVLKKHREYRIAVAGVRARVIDLVIGTPPPWTPHFYRPQTKLREGNVFTPVCLFRGVGFPGCITGHMTKIQGGLYPRGLPTGGWAERPPPPLPLELGKRVVLILLECFLVIFILGGGFGTGR